MLKQNRKVWLLLALAVVVALAVFAPPLEDDAGAPKRAGDMVKGSSESFAKRAGVTQPQADAAHDKLAPPLGGLPQRDSLGKARMDLFDAQSWQPPPPKVVVAPPGPPPPPPPPPMTYRFAGRLVQDGKEVLFVSKGDTPVAVKAGDTLDGYVVESISPTMIALMYPPLRHQERIFVPPAIPGDGAAQPQVGGPLVTTSPPVPVVPFVPPPTLASQPGTGAAALAKPPAGLARVRWEGPAQAKLGANFSVTLRVDSDQPVSGSPMQIRYDPAILESVAVRPGKRYAAEVGRGFNYRITPDGSIVVGATAQSMANSDPELLVLTFKPKKHGAQAEVRLTNLDLQGPGGRVLAHNGLASFRTMVTP